MQPLNPDLYHRLKARFQHVRISNEGESFVGRYVTDPISGRAQLDTQNAGEYYQVCCPFCDDTRYRLYINHTWGVRDDQGSRRLWLASCFNEACLSNPMNRDSLLDDLAYTDGRMTLARLQPGKKVLHAGTSELPGEVQRLDQLPPAHPANRYLAGRGFDPERLGRFYGVGYCDDSRFFLARRRIIVPIHLAGVLRGWQARHVGDPHPDDPNPPPKWWSDPNMKKRYVLYNFDNAVRFQTGVVLEGPGKVWNLGPMGVATLGSSMSEYQARMLVSGFRERSLVLLWDWDVRRDPMKMRHVEKVQSLLTNKFRRGFATIWPPDGIDPDGVDRGDLRRFIEREAKAQGVRVSWKTR